MQTNKESEVVVFVALLGISLTVLVIIGCLRVKGDLAVCRQYYPQVTTAECYFSSKTVVLRRID